MVLPTTGLQQPCHLNAVEGSQHKNFPLPFLFHTFQPILCQQRVHCCKENLQPLQLSEMNITGTLPQAGNLKLFVPSFSMQGSTRPKQNMFNVVLMRPDKIE